MSVIDTLITDRTAADVSRRTYLKERVQTETATTEEAAEWLTDSKGSYNASDLNRVGEACAYLYGVFGDTLGTSVPGYTALRTDWTVDDVPTESDMETYLSTVAALKAIWDTTQDIPETMERLTVDGANNIEKLLAEIDATQKRVMQSWVYSGMVYSGQLWG